MSFKLILTSSLALLSTTASATEGVAPIEPQMVTIKAGELMMGSARRANSQPVHAVAIRAFRMGKYEVTGAEFQKFAEATRYRAPNMCIQMASKRWFENVPSEYAAAATLQTVSKFEPASCIGWKDADAYVKWLAKETGKSYRLPSEAEWEYVHRAGSDARYFFGNDESVACRYANLADRSAEAAVRRDFGLESKEHVGVIPCDDQAGYASIVGMYEPNAFGVHDTLGNISEFVQDCYFETYEGAPTDGSARGNAQCEAHVIRGTSWHHRGAHASTRSWSPVQPEFIGATAGFRVAEDIGTSTVADARPSAFDVELAQAQLAERERRTAAAAAVAAPSSPN